MIVILQQIDILYSWLIPLPVAVILYSVNLGTSKSLAIALGAGKTISLIIPERSVDPSKNITLLFPITLLTFILIPLAGIASLIEEALIFK